MTLVRWNPRSIDREIDNLVRHFWGDAAGSGSAPTNWSPRVDIAEQDDRFTLTAEMPGLSRDEISVTVKDDVLTISGEKKQMATSTEKSHVRAERAYGSFSRSFRLGDRIEASKIEARYTDGVLTLEVPKAEEIKPRSIEVKVG